MSASAERPAEQSLTDYAAQRLHEDIVRCALMPGQAVSEAALAARYGLGKAPIRAALSRLSQTGLIRSLNRRGYVVAPITVKEIVEVFDLRLLLEPHAAFHAAGRMPKRVTDAFDLAYRNFDEASPDSMNAFLRANRDFHVGIGEAAGMDRLSAILGDLLDATERVIRLGLAELRGPQVMETRYRALARALAAGDAAEARTLAAESVEFGRRMIMDAILKSQSVALIPLAPAIAGRS